MVLPDSERLTYIYGENEQSGKRFKKLSAQFTKRYVQKNMAFFSAPGRTEIIGNHTDHNGGLVIAASIDMDTIGAAYPNGTDHVRIVSEGYEQEIDINLSETDSIPKCQGTLSLVAGLMEGMRKLGFAVSGFDAYISTNVIPAAGVSSSASFEMLICTIVNYFFNDSRMSPVDCARIGQYAENTYWQKASGMMDQMACAIGGMVLLDFSDSSHPVYEKLEYSFQDTGYQLVIVNTGKGHADLSGEYSAVPGEMGEAAKALGVSRLCETTLSELLIHCSNIKNDRAVLRAIHFFKENERVKRAEEAIAQEKTDALLQLMAASGTSSWELLQNCYSLSDCKEQKVSLTLALTQLFLDELGKGICRVHGGGFAGVMMCLVPDEAAARYVDYIAGYAGRENVYLMRIRETGAVQIDSVDRE